MDHIKNLRMKDIRVLLQYHFRPEKLKGVPKKVERVETVTEFFRKYREVLAKREGSGMYGATDKSGHKAGEDIGEICRKV